MGYKVRLQKINRSANYTYCVTVPVVLVETAGLAKGEEMDMDGRGQEHLRSDPTFAGSGQTAGNHIGADRHPELTGLPPELSHYFCRAQLEYNGHNIRALRHIHLTGADL